MEPQGVEAVHPAVRVCAVLWRAHDLIVSGKRRRIAAAVADAGFALCGPSSPELWRPGCDEALFAALNEWQRMAFGWGQPPLLAVFDEAKQPAERAELLLLAGQIAGWGLPIDLAPLLSIAPIAREVEAAVDEAFAGGRGAARRSSSAMFVAQHVEMTDAECICGVWRAPDHVCPKHGKLYPSEPVPVGAIIPKVLDMIRDAEARGPVLHAPRGAFEKIRPAEPTHEKPGLVQVRFSRIADGVPAWVFAAILEQAPVDARVMGVIDDWATGMFGIAVRSMTFPVVPEGECAPIICAKVFDSTRQVQVVWPARPAADHLHPELADDAMFPLRAWCATCETHYDPLEAHAHVPKCECVMFRGSDVHQPGCHFASPSVA